MSHESLPPTRERRESGYLNGKKYDIAKVYAFAESIPTEAVPLEQFRNVINEKNDSEFGIDGKFLRPHEIVRDWEKIRSDPEWRKHADSITNVDVEMPILVSHAGHVLDGQHRIIKSFLEGRTEIKIKRLPEVLPADLEME